MLAGLKTGHYKDLLRRRAGLGALGTVLRTSLLAVFDSGRIQGAANNVITNAGKILHAAAAHEHDGVLLQVMADARDIGGDLDGIGQTHTRHFAERGVRLLRGLRIYANAHAALFGAAHERGRLGLGQNRFSSHAYKLRKRRHSRSSFSLGSPRENIPGSPPRFARRHRLQALTLRAHKNARAHTNAERSLRIRRDQQETPHRLQETERSSRYRIGEAYSAFRGWRPIPAALPSHSVLLVPGPKNFLPTSHPPQTNGRT